MICTESGLTSEDKVNILSLLFSTTTAPAIACLPESFKCFMAVITFILLMRRGVLSIQ